MSHDIRKWFMNAGNGNSSKQANPSPVVQEVTESSGRRKTSKYFSEGKMEVEDVSEYIAQGGSAGSVDNPSGKKIHKLEDNDDDDDFVTPTSRKGFVDATPKKMLKSGSGKGVAWKKIVAAADEGLTVKYNEKSSGGGEKGSSVDQSTEDMDGKDAKSVEPWGRGRSGGGRGGFMNFGERKDPPHKGEKEVPEGASDCLHGYTFVISGTLDSLEREEAEDLIKRHGGRITGSVSKKTNYLLCDEDNGGRKSEKAKELGTIFITEDGLFDMIRASNNSKEPVNKPSPPKKCPQTSVKSKQAGEIVTRSDTEALASIASSMRKNQPTSHTSLPWTEKYRPKVPNDIVGNKSLVTQLHDWLVSWNEHFLDAGKKGKGKGKTQNDSGAKKVVLLTGRPGIGKTTSAKLVSQMLGFQTIEVNASDSRGKSDGKIERGIQGSTSNSIKELVRNQILSPNPESSQHVKTVLIMDEVDGMSAGDRGGVADLIASIKISKIPVICICNDRYSQKLKSLVGNCLILSFQKPENEQIVKRLSQITSLEGIQINKIALQELAKGTSGDIRMAVNHLQYVSVSMPIINSDDIKQRLQSNSKDEVISPFAAVDKLFDFNRGKLRMDERMDLSMSDPDLVPLLIQENYINHRPSDAGVDDNGMKRMDLLVQAAESIGDGDIINVQIRRYQLWKLSQSGCVASCITLAALMRGKREIFKKGEHNYNRFGGWLGKNSTMQKNNRLLKDLHAHLFASRESHVGRSVLRTDNLTLLSRRLTEPLRMLSKDEAVKKVVEFMELYSISMDDFKTNIEELSKFEGRPSPMDGIQPAVKAALTKAYNRGSSSRVIRTADLITLPGIRKGIKKRVAAMLEPLDNNMTENKEESLSDNEEDPEDDSVNPEKQQQQLQSDLQSLNSKAIQVHMDLKGSASSSGKNAPSGRRGKGSAAGRGGGRGSGSVSKRFVS